MNEEDEFKPFQKKWVWSDGRKRDRFQVEFNEDERNDFVDMQLFLRQSMDATAIKQMAYIGWFAISNQPQFIPYIRDVLFKNEQGNRRLGKVTETEINDKFQRKKLKLGGKL